MNIVFGLDRIATDPESPEVEPVSLAEMKLHLRAYDDITAEDAMITEMIREAREWVEDYTGRALVDQQWRLSVDFTGGPLLASAGVPADSVEGFRASDLLFFQRANRVPLRRSPIIALTAVTQFDSNGDETVLDPADFNVFGAQTKWPAVSLQSWSASGSGSMLQFEYRAGMVNREVSPPDPLSVIPPAFKRAIKLIVGHYYEHREPILVGTIASELQLSIPWLLAAQRCELGIA